MRTYGVWLHGKEQPIASRKTFVSLNPANEKLLAEFVAGTKKDVDAAVMSAKKAQPLWSQLPAPQRGDILLEIACLLKKNKERLGKLVSTEMGKVLKEGLGDVQEAIDVFEYMAGEGRRLFGYTTPSELPHKTAYTARVPLGVVGMITPWNFPIAIPAWKIAPALICGNSLVLKPSSDTPLCAYELVKLCYDAGVPSDVVNMVTGSGDDVGLPLVSHTDVRGVSFTGSRAVGEHVVKHAGLKKVGLEMGGKNPIIVMDDANLDLALDGVIWGAFGTTGQRCTAASRLIVHKTIARDFVERLITKTEKLRVGDPLKSTTDVGPLVNQAAVEKVERYVAIGEKEGATVACGGGRQQGKGFFFSPTIFTKVTPAMKIAQEEIFGPVLSVLVVNDLRGAIAVCNATDYGLSSAIYTQDIQKAFLAIEQIEAGIVYVNSSTIGAEVHLPFGGVKQTGNGAREAGIEGIHEFSETKVVYIDYSGHLQKAQGIE